MLSFFILYLHVDFVFNTYSCRYLLYIICEKGLGGGKERRMLPYIISELQIEEGEKGVERRVRFHFLQYMAQT